MDREVIRSVTKIKISKGKSEDDDPTSTKYNSGMHPSVMMSYVEVALYRCNPTEWNPDSDVT